jgi:hypothetical protein
VECYTASNTVPTTNTMLQKYIANKTRFIVRAAGNFDLSCVNTKEIDEEPEEEDEADPTKIEKNSGSVNGKADKADSGSRIDIEAYRPTIKDREWFVSELDLDWISTGCYILGTGGGGSPHSSMLRLRSILRDGGVVRVIDPNDLKDDDLVGCGGGAGSPTVGIEKLQGDE